MTHCCGNSSSPQALSRLGVAALRLWLAALGCGGSYPKDYTGRASKYKWWGLGCETTSQFDAVLSCYHTRRRQGTMRPCRKIMVDLPHANTSCVLRSMQHLHSHQCPGPNSRSQRQPEDLDAAGVAARRTTQPLPSRQPSGQRLPAGAGVGALALAARARESATYFWASAAVMGLTVLASLSASAVVSGSDTASGRGRRG